MKHMRVRRHKGSFIVIEGTDGAGKATQFKLLVQALQKIGHKVGTVDFPQYGRPSAYFVEQYLNGVYGTAKQVGPYRGSLFYALDRYVAAPQIREWLTQGRIVIANRYTWSNAGHQGGKILNSAKRRAYWKWLFDLEFKLLGIPKPDLTIVLHMPAKQAQLLVDKKMRRKYIKTKAKRDLHENDLKHLQAAEATYLQLARLSRAKLVECVEKGRLLTPIEIHRKVLIIVRKNLP